MQALDEIQAGVFDGWTYDQIAEKHPEEYAARKRDKLRYRRAHSALTCIKPFCNQQNPLLLQGPESN